MLLDASLQFVPLGSAMSLVGGAGVNLPSGIIDLLGQGVGTAPQNIIGNVTLFGTDLGIGDDRLLLECTIGTALVTATSATLTIAIQAAVDLGTPTYQPGTWQTLVQSPAITAAQGTAGARVARLDWPPAFPEGLQPRYMRLLAIVPSATDFTAGTLSFAGWTSDRDDYAVQYAARNYTVS